MREEILRLEKICVSFHKSNVLKNVRLNLYKNEILSVVSRHRRDLQALIAILTGNQQPDSGYLFYEQKETIITSPYQAISQGIHYVGYESKIVPNLSIAHNLLALSPGTDFFVNLAECYRQCARVFRSFGLDFSPKAPTYLLNKNDATIIELLKAYLGGAKIILIGDIFAEYTPTIFSRFSGVLRELKSRGVSVILFNRSISPTSQIADRIAILRNGGNAGELMPDEFEAEYVPRMILGNNFRDVPEYTSHKSDTPLLEVKGYPISGARFNLDFTIQKGEILGIFDTENFTEISTFPDILDMIAGYGVRVTLDSEPVQPKNVADALDLGIVCFHNRVDDMCFYENLTIGENLAIQTEKKPDTRLRGSYRKAAPFLQKECMQRFSFPPGCHISDLSLTQKYQLLLFKWEILCPRLIVALHPFSQINDLSKAILFPQIETLTKKKAGMILISSNIAEISTLCDRILIINKERGIQIFNNSEFRSLQIDKILYSKETP